MASKFLNTFSTDQSRKVSYSNLGRRPILSSKNVLQFDVIDLGPRVFVTYLYQSLFSVSRCASTAFRFAICFRISSKCFSLITIIVFNVIQKYWQLESSPVFHTTVQSTLIKGAIIPHRSQSRKTKIRIILEIRTLGLRILNFLILHAFKIRSGSRLQSRGSSTANVNFYLF